MEELKDIKIDPEKLRQARGDRGLSESARAIGVTRQQLWNYENDCGEPPSSAIARLCLLYGVSIESLVNADKKTLKKMYIAA